MTMDEKLAQLKTLLQITGTAQDTQLTAYLNLAKSEILSWLYSGNTPDGVTDVPLRYEAIQVSACVVGFSMIGAEGQTKHSEGGISRDFKFEDMVAYIHSHVCPYVGVN